MSDTFQVELSISEIGVGPGDSSFEAKCLAKAREKASELAAEMLAEWEGVGLRDIDVRSDDSVYVILKREVPRAVEVEVAPTPPVEDGGWPVGEEIAPEGEAEPQVEGPPEGFVTIEDSEAYKGPLGDQRYEMDIVDLCAMLDVMGFAQQIAAAAGATSPTIARSMKKLEVTLAGHIAVDDPETQQRRPSDDFLQHMNSWMRESTEMFEKAVAQGQKKVVRAQMVPGPDFDPTGGNLPPGAVPGRAVPRMGPPPVHIPGGSRRR